MSLITEIEHLDMIQNIEMIVRSDRVFENCYDKDSPEVIQWTEYFTKRPISLRYLAKSVKESLQRNFFMPKSLELSGIIFLPLLLKL